MEVWAREHRGQQEPGRFTCSLAGQGRTGQVGRVQVSEPPLQVHDLQGLVTSCLVWPSCRETPCHLQEEQVGQHWWSWAGTCSWPASQPESHLVVALVRTPSQHVVAPHLSTTVCVCLMVVVLVSAQCMHSWQHWLGCLGCRL